MKSLALVSIPLAVLSLTAVPATAQKPGLPPGIYFLWTPPGPNTVTIDRPYLPNNDYVVNQSRMNELAAKDLRASGPLGPRARAAAGAPEALNLTWFRIATAGGDHPPDLHQGGADEVRAGRTALLWFGNEQVTDRDSVFVTARVFRADDLGGAPAAEITPPAPLPPGRWGSKSALSLGALPAGRYVVRIHLLDHNRGLDQWLERWIDAREDR